MNLEALVFHGINFYFPDCLPRINVFLRNESRQICGSALIMPQLLYENLNNTAEKLLGCFNVIYFPVVAYEIISCESIFSTDKLFQLLITDTWNAMTTKLNTHKVFDCLIKNNFTACHWIESSSHFISMTMQISLEKLVKNQNKFDPKVLG